MRYRALDMNDDSTFCSGLSYFYVNSPQAVAQLVKTNLRLIQGEWFLDSTAGVPYLTQVVGKYTAASRDAVIQAAILATTGVLSIVSYNSNFNSQTRAFQVQATIDTIYTTAGSSQAAIDFAFNILTSDDGDQVLLDDNGFNILTDR